MSKTVLITGSTDGIGKQTAFDLAALGYDILIHGRDITKCKNVTQEITAKHPKVQVNYFVADLSVLKDIEQMSDEIHKKYTSLNVLINNAGLVENTRKVDKNGIERTFMVNHLAPFYLTLLLLDLIKEGRPSRIINVSSQVHAASIDFDNLQGERNYEGRKAYGLSKLGNILFANELVNRLQDESIAVNSLHPGVIDTNLIRKGWNMRGSDVSTGTKTIVYLTISEEGSAKTGGYFSNEQEKSPKPVALDREKQKKLWETSEKLLNIDSSIYLNNSKK